MIYNIIIYIYLFGVAVYSLFNEKVRKMWRGERSAFGVLKAKVDPTAQYVWFHAASLGEFEQGRPLMERLRRDHPEYKILLTFFSPSGYEVRKNYEGADIICYLPLDTPINAIRFLRLIRPVMAFFIKYEFWYNYLHILKHRHVPVYSVSSIFRPGQVFFKWYGRQYGRVLNCFTHFFVQNEVSKQLLAKIGITNVTIVGDTRFDRVMQVKSEVFAAAIPSPAPTGIPEGNSSLFTLHSSLNTTLHSSLSSLNKVFVAGSSWPPDEEIFIRYFREHPEWKLIIAPHVIAEDHLQQIEKMLEGWHVERYTKVTQSPPEENTNGLQNNEAVGEAMIIDCFGLLSTIYRYATVAYVGGGFGVGIHNTVEAAVWGVPVIFGPNNQKFQEAQQLKACGGGFEISSYDDFARLMDRFSADKQYLREASHAAGNYVESKAGATSKILEFLSLNL
jgi:3-deoxy-D-manno-octulosonic-acid transferase